MTKGVGAVGGADAELDARICRIKSEIVEASRSAGEGDEYVKRLKEVKQKLSEIAGLADKEQRVLAVHEIEATLCILKPEHLLFPTWIRLRGSLYRFEKARRKDWEQALTVLFTETGEVRESELARCRLRQLTLELQEAAARYNRLARERAAVVRGVNRVGIFLVVGFLSVLVVCFSVSSMQVSAPGTLAVVLGSCAVAGGMGATFSRLTTIRRERTRYAFSETFKWDIAARVCLGAAAAVFIASALLSEFLPIDVPEQPTKRLSFLVLFGFGAGFSDRLFNATLERVIGRRAPRRSVDSD